MWSNTFLRYVTAITIVFVLMALTIKYTMKSDTTWRDVSSQGLHTKIQTGLTQMYWQWQAQGRATSIEYWPQNAEQAFVINMSSTGLPVVNPDNEGCLTFLNWFVDKKILNKNVNVTITYIQKTFEEQGQSAPRSKIQGEQAKEVKGEAIHSYCQFHYAGKVHQYDITTGQLRFAD